MIYQRCLAIEFDKNKIVYAREFEMPIKYNEIEVGTRRVDFLVDDKVMVELKALNNLEPVHLAQGINYLEAYNLEIGLLINFGAKQLEFKRLLNRKFKEKG